MSDLRIQRAFETILATWATAQSIPVAWDNMLFDPAGQSRFLRASLIPNEPKNQFLDCTHVCHTGIFQVLVTVRPGRVPGRREAQELAAAVSALYPMNVALSNGGLTFRLTSPMGAVEAIPEQDRYTMPVYARYRADTTA